MNTTAQTAHADQLHAEVRAARSYDGHAASCDALDPCNGCKGKARTVAATRHAERVEAATAAPRIPQPRTGDLHLRLAAARS